MKYSFLVSPGGGVSLLHCVVLPENAIIKATIVVVADVPLRSKQVELQGQTKDKFVVSLPDELLGKEDTIIKFKVDFKYA